ncbi:MAG: DUF397 domain-containing protein [Pseudonocardiaceae bacterium]
MPQVADGMQATPPRGIRWTKSSHSNPHGDCVEVAELPGGKIALRDSQRPGGPALVYARAELAAFVQALKENEFVEMAGDPPTRAAQRPRRAFRRPGCRLG